MTQFGYTMMCEQSPPDRLVSDLVLAEQAGFHFSVISDHYQPWLAEQGHAGYAWSILGAAAQATQRIGLMTYVTCPTLRYHPAIVAQKAATVQILSGGRFRLGLGAGENLNEHVVGQRWPAVGERHPMLVEATEIIKELLGGGQLPRRVLRRRAGDALGRPERPGADRGRVLRSRFVLAGGPPRRHHGRGRAEG
jgi:G6PDH family F420-dependent oxidoreductase